jgi:NAD(P)-dependent dehydrogenase (short-subunit alcohol dehydrogenase family)
MKKFEGKVAAITGAASGIGRALALELARRKCNLALCCDRNVKGLNQTATEARSRGVEVTTRQLDVADRDAVHAWADEVAADHGRVNLIFNNAAVELACTVESIDYDDFEWVMNVNFWGTVYGTKAFLPHLKQAGEGHIVNISSVFGLMSAPAQCAYNSAKFAMRGFTDCLREELEMMDCGVSATSIHPGGIKTPIIRSGRVDESIAELGIDPDSYRQKFERAFITSPEKAARDILRAVKKDKRRALIGPDAYVYDGITRMLPDAYHPLVIAYTRQMMK